jgi:tetratricopeptide (TPR) repeat protein
MRTWFGCDNQKRLTAPIVLMTLMVVVAGCDGQVDGPDVEKQKRLAGELRDNKLFSAAIEEYRKVLASDRLDDEQRGNINYLIARIYFEDLKDYRQAAAYYVRARAYNPEASHMPETSRNLVASLEKLGQFVDARRELGAVADVDAGPRQADDRPVALISGDTVWMSEVEAEIQVMPGELQNQLGTLRARVEFVRQYVGTELLYRAAVREGYDRDPEVIKNVGLLTRKLVLDRYVAEKVMPEVRIDTVDVRNYYLANKDSLYGGAVYDSVRTRVFFDYQTQKAEAAYTQYLNRLTRSENVTFLDKNVR